MIRYILGPGASQDLSDIRRYLANLPPTPGYRIGFDIKQALRVIAAHPYLGLAQSELTRAFGQEVRSWPVDQYRIYYRLGSRTLEVLGVLHAARDHIAILRQRIQ